MLNVTSLLFCLLTAQVPSAPVMESGTTSTGSLRVYPDRGLSGEYGTWTVEYIGGPEGIATNGGIRVQLPDEWHSGIRNSANSLQADDPAGDHYVTARCSNPAVRVKAVIEDQREFRLVKHEKTGLDGRRERYVFVVRVLIQQGKLAEGDRISLVYGDTTGGSRGYRASSVAIAEAPILVAIDQNGDNRFQLHESRPRLTARPGPPTVLQCILPSDAVVGDQVEALVSLLDKEFNPAAGPSSVRIRVIDGTVEVPGHVAIGSGVSHARFPLTPEGKGTIRLSVEVIGESVHRLTANSNPMVAHVQPPDAKLYWGDLHSHTRFSWDGVGTNAFDYARNTSGLDFYAMTDHARVPRDGLLRGLSEAYWKDYQAMTEKAHRPGRFVALHAYECSLGRPYGHHNIYFRGEPGPLFYPSRDELPDIWAQLRAGDALTIPHHTGKFPNGVDFGHHDPRFRRNFEIYSAHGLSEVFDPSHPLAAEYSLFTGDSRSLNHPSHIQDAWRLGLHVSAIASSDDHRAHPGLAHYGLAAVRAPELTRDAIFQALYDRQTYATTGSRIILDFVINGAHMGEVANMHEIPEIAMSAIGTDNISLVELLRFRPGEDRFHVIRSWVPMANEFREIVTDAEFVPGSVYYFRLRQQRLVLGRLAMAWSSPIWTESAR